MSRKWSVPLTHTFASTTHTFAFPGKRVPLCLSICTELSYKSPHTSTLCLSSVGSSPFSRTKGPLLAILPSYLFEGWPSSAHTFCVHVCQCFSVCMWEMCACMCPLPIPNPAGFFAKINLPVDDSEILQESHPEGEWANTSAMLLHQWAEQMNERQWQRWREKKGSANGP